MSIVYRIVVFIGLLPTISALYAQTNRALFVAIDQYPEEGGWTKIHATNDSRIIIPMLKKQGFFDKNISILLNEKATKKAILEQLDRIYKQSSLGDFIYIHFSCHGQQMFDDNGDEEDGLDEALIPYDARRRYVKGKYEGENHLRDDELEVKLDRIRTKIGSTGNVVVVLDACHSGTATRYGDDDEYVRGTTYIFAPDNYDPKDKKDKKPNLSLKKSKNLSPISVFSACKADEVNYEYRLPEQKEFYGSLSYAIGRLAENASGAISNIQFSKQLDKEMKIMFAKKRWKQTPYFESTDGRRVFKIGR